MGRYVKPEKAGGALPITRYLSKPLLNRVKVDELLAYSRVLPAVLNRLPHDKDYAGGMPTRTVEALQTWEALQSLNDEIIEKDMESSLKNLSEQVARAKAAYAQLQGRGISEGSETITEYLDQLSGAVDGFKKLAEL